MNSISRTNINSSKEHQSQSSNNPDPKHLYHPKNFTSNDSESISGNQSKNRYINTDSSIVHQNPSSYIINPSTNFDSSYPYSKQSLIASYASWIKELRSTHAPMAITAVFRSQSFKPQKCRWLDEYQHKVIWKINKQISRKAPELLVNSVIAYYEHSHVQSTKSLKDYRYPHHVHGIVFIKNEHLHKVWDIASGTIRPSLQRDFDSIKTVSSVLMEPLSEGGECRWMSYITKRKSFND